MSFNVTQGSQGYGLMMQSSSSFHQFEGAQEINCCNAAPQIYSAVYSTVDVYEMEVNGIAVMRRRKDSWLNATQILKVAGIEKGKRTKVLEKEILIGEHEKVQGGYGKYQGTWVKFERGVEFCKQYGVEELLRPLLTYDMGQDGSVAGRGIIDTPTKEQAMAAQRKRLYNASTESRPNSQTGSIFKSILSTASHAVAAINKARYDSPGPRSRNNSTSRLRNFGSHPSQQQALNPQETSSFSISSTSLEQNTANLNSVENFNVNQEIPYATSFSQTGRNDLNSEYDEPPRKRVRPSPRMTDSQPNTQDGTTSTLMREVSPNEPNEPFGQTPQQALYVNNHNIPLQPLHFTPSSHSNAKKDLLLSLFTDYTQCNLSKHKGFETLSPEDLDMPIDKTCNTALIWAATLARVDLLKHLIARGASIFRVNSAGETALMRSCLVTNNLEMGNFPRLLELLGPTIEIRDSKGRTVLHHIAVTSAVKGRSQASKYYLESLLEFVVRGSGAPFNHQPITDGRKLTPSIGIGRFMSEIVNVQDSSGDTALMIASRIGNRSIISQLIEVGADVSIPNRSHLTPADFGVGDGSELDIKSGERSQANLPVTESKETSKDIITSMTTLLKDTETEFNTEMKKKQNIIDDIHSNLRAESGVLGQRRRLFESLQAEQHKVDTRNLKIKNLTRACDEEKSRLLQMNPDQDQLGDENMFELGDADKDFKISGEALDALSKINMNHEKLPDLTDSELKSLASSLPPADVLRARVNAYTSTNEALENSVIDFKSKDSELTRKYRKIISLCTGIDENRVEGSIDSLVRSLESEQDDVELGRVRKFLSRVEAV
ncbi:Start control protein cdc10 [Golovinomyces cichoracearum]|uniref:Transcription factor SWI6 n=1 Tax=Golovinomyces cichoracearum TaxID=62708 RepID=A0A420HNU0_9PEZI|nr:Start control protein cdc10 [Golovinomyces cichoracearum]